MDGGIPEFLAAYLVKIDAHRAEAMNEALRRLTDRELLLFKEAAVMGYVQGMRHPQEQKYPGDREVLARVTDACLGFPDLYPTIAGYAPEPDDDEEETA
jgi:hypothetical protein